MGVTLLKGALGVLAALAASPTRAGPLEGEMFGYRLGATYPVSNATQGYSMPALSQMVVFAEKPNVSSDFERVELITSAKTYTIANIIATASFQDEKRAELLANKYADLLGTMYQTKCRPITAHLGEKLHLQCGPFRMSVYHFKPTKAAELHKVHVGLKFDDDSEPGKRVVELMTREVATLEAEGQRVRLEKARKEQRLKGLE